MNQSENKYFFNYENGLPCRSITSNYVKQKSDTQFNPSEISPIFPNMAKVGKLTESLAI